MKASEPEPHEMDFVISPHHPGKAFFEEDGQWYEIPLSLLTDSPGKLVEVLPDGTRVPFTP